jgi:SAM-dependent methyltransferase
MLARLRSRVARALPDGVAHRISRLRRTAAPDPLDNVAYNRRLWDWYARTWSEDPAFRVQQADVPPPTAEDASRLSVLGGEWGTPRDLEHVLSEYLDPFAHADSVVGEIGSGGGRIAARLAPRVAELYCFDISQGMLDHAKRTLAGHTNVRYVLLERPSLPLELRSHFDLLYSFDVFVHLDLHTIWSYIREVAAALRPGGHAFLHTANLTAPGGWESFESQERYRPESHYFISPEIVRTMVGHTDLRFVKESTPDPDNFYLNRDYLFVLQRPV